MILAQGAEAVLIRKGNKVIKKRIEKKYRHPLLDEKLRTQRTRHETRILEKAYFLIPTAKVLESSESKKEIVLQYIQGKKLAEALNLKNAQIAGKQVGKHIATLHQHSIIHGDLTTSNMILQGKEVYIIDFGLGFHSNQAEDKAVDLHVLKEALEAKHPLEASKFWKGIISGYKSKESQRVLTQLEKVEKRGRYKSQY